MERESGLSVELLFYNVLEELKRSIPTYIDWIDEVIAIDGRHRSELPPNNKLSTDGSREYLKSFDKVHLIDKPDEYEVEKRKLAKNLCRTENLIIIDSDSYVIGNWEEFFKSYDKIKAADTKRINLYKLKLQRSDYLQGYFDFPLVYYKPWEFTYYRNKHAIPVKKILANNPNIYAPTSFHITISGIKVMHDHSLSTPKRSDFRTVHRRFLRSYENP